MKRTAVSFVLTCALIGEPSSGTAGEQRPARDPPWQTFLAAASADDRAARRALQEIGSVWRDGYTAMFIDIARLLPSHRGTVRGDEHGVRLDDDDLAGGARAGVATDALAAPPRPGAIVRSRLTSFLEQQTGRRFGDDLRSWRRWMWELPYDPHPGYAAFKAALYSRIDPAFRGFFPDRVQATIRLDEIDWGGVRVNGIPPLRSPKVTDAASAGWLRDGHIVFGVEINGEARAYPKRILAWHARLKNKAEVLVIRPELLPDGAAPLAIAADLLKRTPIFSFDAGGRGYVVVTSRDGANRVYERGGRSFIERDTAGLRDGTGTRWKVLEDGLVSETGDRLARVPAHRVFWFAWRAQYPNTALFK
jgi:hypothetical protein